MSITSQLLALTQQQAQIQETTQHANMLQAQTAALNRQAAVAQQTRQIAQQYALARENAASVAAGGPGAPQGGGIDANPDMQAINGRIAQRTADYNNFSGLSQKLMAGGGDLKLAQQYDDNARQAQADIATEQTRALETRKNLIQQLTSVAGSASADTWDDTKAQLDSLAPGWDKGKNLDFDPLNGGEVTWGPRTQRAMQALNEQGQTAYQQAETKWRTAQEMRLSAQEETAARRETAYEQDVDSKIATRRANVARADEKAATGRTPTTKEPTMHEVADLAGDLADQHQLSDSQSRLMASDILRRRNELLAKDPHLSIADASSQATQEAEGRVKDATTSGGVLGMFKTYTPASYTRVGKPTSDAASTTDADKGAASVVQPFTKAGIPVEYTGGVLTSRGAAVPMTDALYAQLPSGTVFLAPDGKKHRKP